MRTQTLSLCELTCSEPFWTDAAAEVETLSPPDADSAPGALAPKMTQKMAPASPTPPVFGKYPEYVRSC